VRNGAGWEGEIEAGWLRPVIKSPREIKTLRVRLEDLHYLIFMPPEDIRKALDQGRQPPLSRYPKATAYIGWGEKQGYPTRPTCASRTWWWDLGEHQLPLCVWFKAFNDRFGVPYCGRQVASSDRLYEIYAVDRPTEDLLAASLNSTVTHIGAELAGRVNLGEGALDNMTYEAARNVILNPLSIAIRRSELLFHFNHMTKRPIRSIFEELGFSLCRERKCDHPEHPYEHVQPEALTLEQVQRASPDRFELDAVVFDVLGLTKEERLEVYKAVAQLVKDRLVKARSVGQ